MTSSADLQAAHDAEAVLKPALKGKKGKKKGA